MKFKDCSLFYNYENYSFTDAGLEYFSQHRKISEHRFYMSYKLPVTDETSWSLIGSQQRDNLSRNK